MASPARVIKISTTLLRHFVSGVAKKFLSKERYPVATSFKAAFEELGPAFIKLGQFLSIRSDLIGHERTKVFESLQDNAPKLEFYKVKDLVEHSLLAPIDELFKTFEERELAAASISQVHRAVTNAGDVVAVKIQRPDAAALLKGDVALFVNLALVLNKLPFINK
ncbi:MAG: ubiquinone biosynthesis regulatory protein kinase UbiB, partial [Deltaproteobacteria bacterium]